MSDLPPVTAPGNGDLQEQVLGLLEAMQHMAHCLVPPVSRGQMAGFLEDEARRLCVKHGKARGWGCEVLAVSLMSREERKSRDV